MKNTFKAVALGLSLLLATVSVCSAQDLQKGLAAYDAKDFAAALREFRFLAEQGDAEGQYFLGTMYSGGEGVTQDYKEAVRLYRLAAAQGNPFALLALGNSYAFGQGVTQDYKEAARLYGLAAAQGHPRARFFLDALPKSGAEETQKVWLRVYGKAAAQGNANAQYNLGRMYANGEGIAQDYKEAARLYGLAAAQGNADAQSNLDLLNKSITATAPDNFAPAVAEQGASDAFIRRIASTAALSSLILAAFLSFLIFRFTAYRYWKKVRVTAIQNGIWCGGIFASMAPYPVMNKMARDGFSEIPLQLVVTTFLFFTLAFACGYAWRKLKAAPNTAQHHSEETKVGLSGEIKMNALLLRPSLLAGVAGFLVPILMKPYGPIAFSHAPLSTWFDRGDGLIMCFAGAIAAFALVEMYQRLRKP